MLLGNNAAPNNRQNVKSPPTVTETTAGPIGNKGKEITPPDGIVPLDSPTATTAGSNDTTGQSTDIQKVHKNEKK